MAVKFRNKLPYDLEVGHAYLVRMATTEPIKESANTVMFYIGEYGGYPAFTPILDDDPMENEATLDYMLFKDVNAEGVVAVIGRFELVDCNPDDITRGKKQPIAPELPQKGKKKMH